MAKHYDDDGPTRHNTTVNASSLSKGKEGSESFEVVWPTIQESTETKAKEVTRTGVCRWIARLAQAASLPLLRGIPEIVKSHPATMVPSRQAAEKISRTLLTCCVCS